MNVMNMNKLGLVQTGDCGNVYNIITPHNITVAQIMFPPDAQFMHDQQILNIITRAIAIRWGFIEHKPRNQNI